MHRRGSRGVRGWLVRALALGVLTVSAVAAVAAAVAPPAQAGDWWHVTVAAAARDGNDAPAQGVPFVISFLDPLWGDWDEAVLVTGVDGGVSRAQAGFEEDGYPTAFHIALSDPNGVYTVASRETDGFFGDTDSAWVLHTYRLADAGAISGVVRDAQGVPTADIGVQLYVRDASGAWQSVVTSQSDGSGRYRFAALGSRDYAVRFAYPMPAGPRFWQGGPDPDSAGIIALGQDEARLDIDGEPFERLPGSLGGWVATKSLTMGVGVPVHAWRIAEDGQLLEAGATTTDESGYYVIGGLEPGSYTLSIYLGRQARPLWLGNERKADDAEIVTVDWDEHVVGLAFEVPRGKLSSPATRRR